MVSTKSGHLFERRVIEKHLAEAGTCPISGEPLAKDDLLAVQGPAKLNPRPASATSIPGLLSLFQAEWDAVMLETYQLRQQVHGHVARLSPFLGLAVAQNPVDNDARQVADKLPHLPSTPRTRAGRRLPARVCLAVKVAGRSAGWRR